MRLLCWIFNLNIRSILMLSAWQSLKEKFESQDRCDRPSCIDGINDTNSRLVYPPDRSQIGRANWKYVHKRASNFPDTPSADQQRRELDWIHSFIYTYPCGVCARDFTSICLRIPPVVTSRQAYEHWWYVVHNEVNKDLSKPIFHIDAK